MQAAQRAGAHEPRTARRRQNAQRPQRPQGAEAVASRDAFAPSRPSPGESLRSNPSRPPREVGSQANRGHSDRTVWGGPRRPETERTTSGRRGVIVTAITQTDADFAFAGLDTPEAPPAAAIRALGGPDPLGALAGLEGTWKGHGFNAIWRPHNPPSQDRFLELNMTDETLVFTRINGPIPNRGLAMHDINMFGLTYMQQISETSTGAGLHIEPGIWANGPPHHRSQRAALGRADGVDPARHRHPRPGRRRGPPRRPSEHPRQQHPAVLLRQPTAGEQRLQLGRADVHRAQAVDSDNVPLRRSRRHSGRSSRTPTASCRPRLRPRFRARA